MGMHTMPNNITKIIDSAVDLIKQGNNEEQIKNYLAVELHRLEGHKSGIHFFTRQSVHRSSKTSIPLEAQLQRLLKMYNDPIKSILSDAKIKAAFDTQEASSSDKKMATSSRFKT